MGRRSRTLLRSALLAAAGLALAGCAGMAPLPQRDTTGTIERAPLELAGRTLEATWYWPAVTPRALLVLEHGFARRCDHLRAITRQLMATSVAAVCIDASMAGGNPRLAEALAERLAQGWRAPGNRDLPPRLIVGGHSAGAVFAAHLGAALATLAPRRLAGALMFDPVATPGFEGDLRRLSDDGRRPVLAVLAPPHACNAEGNARVPLARVRDAARAAGRDTVALEEGGDDATHADAEGDDSDALARVACGTPRPVPVARLREHARRWLNELLDRPDAGPRTLSARSAP